MNNNFIIIVTLFFISCSEEKIQLISNTPSDLPVQNYKLNLKSLDSGGNLESVTITWNETNGEVILMDSNTPITSTGNSHKFSEMTPGEFRDILLQVETDNLTYIDSIQIFTRTVSPISNFKFEIDAIKVGEDVWNSWEKFTDLGDDIWNPGEPFEDKLNGTWDEGEPFTDLVNNIWDEGEPFTDLGNDVWDEGEPFEDSGDGIWNSWEPFEDELNGTWDEGEPFEDLGNNIWDEGEPFEDLDTTKYHRNLKWTKTNESSAKYILYRVKSENIDDLVKSDCNACQLDVLPSLSDTTYIDSSTDVIDELDENAFYYMAQVSTVNFTINSFIYNYTDFPQPESIQLTGENVSTDKNEFIEIIWNPITNSDYFYQYEIWRSSNEALSDQAQIAIITDPDQGKFMDRTSGNGTTWYYSVAIVDINGRKKYSDFVPGWSMP